MDRNKTLKRIALENPKHLGPRAELQKETVNLDQKLMDLVRVHLQGHRVQLRRLQNLEDWKSRDEKQKEKMRPPEIGSGERL